jgi:hypothetical protein
MKNKKNEQKKKEIKRAVKRVKMGKKAWATTDKSKHFEKDLPTIKIIAQRKVTMIELDIDLCDEAKKLLMTAGMENIVKDEKAIMSYGFCHLLRKGIDHAKKLK